MSLNGLPQTNVSFLTICHHNFCCCTGIKYTPNHQQCNIYISCDISTADHRDGLLSSGFSLIHDSRFVSGHSVCWRFGSNELCSNPAFSRGRQRVPFDLKIACLCQSIAINNNKHVYRQSQVRKPNGSGVEWAKCSLIIGTGC